MIFSSKSGIFLLSIAFILYLSCKRNDDVACTSMFASVSIEVTGGILDDYFSIRISTGDTIRFTDGPFQNSYTVLNDNYRQMLEDNQETFRFVGIKSDTVAVNENFVISADKCHISRISGKSNVNI